MKFSKATFYLLIFLLAGFSILAGCNQAQSPTAEIAEIEITSAPTETPIPPTNTPIPPTDEPSPTSTPTSIPTSTETPIPPTETPVPTDTPPRPTSTPQPVTISVCAEGCDFISIQAAIDDPGTQAGDVIGVLDEVHTEAGITVNKDVTIQGQGAEKTVVQANARSSEATDRVFWIEEGATAQISQMTIRNGHPSSAPFAGGGIFNYGTLTLENCLVRKNQAGDGGGIFNRGQLIVVNSTIKSNYSDGNGEQWIECGSGGGINTASGSSLKLFNSTITSNQSERRGGAIHVACESVAVLVDSTINENKAAHNGGGINVGGTLKLTNSAVTRNSASNMGGGVYVRGTMDYTNTLIAKNIAGGNCTIGGDGGYRGTGTVGIQNNTLVPTNNCRPQ